MRTLKGVILLLIGLGVTVFELIALIYVPIVKGNSTGFSDIQYWGLVLPSLFVTLLFSLIMAWVGYTMVTTKEPVRFTYEQAYEAALSDMGMVDGNSEKQGSGQKG
ncbi:MAG: hypothetical protein D6732_27795 [Methanobacteriota archaeon]|nr:MAG: hypothetical protein D6732_27795 [Euryarchaeota archaeon]